MHSRRRLFASRLRGIFAARRCDRELDDELQTHISLLAERYAAQGMSREEARDAAHRQFGNLTLVKEATHEMRRFSLLETFSKDAGHGARLLLRSPGLAAAALLTLALGIGASTAIFSLVRGILLRPLPYADAGRIIVPATIFPRYNTDRGSVAWSDIRDWKGQRDLFDSVSAMNQGDVDITGGEETERAPGLIADEEYFRAMGAPPLIGRFFTADENVPDAGRVAVLTYRFWMRRFGGDPAAVGSRMEIGGVPHLILGVARKDSTWPEDVEIIRPMGTGGTPTQNMLRRDNHAYRAIARLKAGVTLEQAQAKLTVMGERIAKQETNRAGTNWKLHSLADYIVGPEVRRTLLVLFGAVLVILLIACVNVANLLLARGAAREREVAIRGALGAGRLRLAGQFLAESALLAAGGGLAGILAGYGGLRALVHFAPADVPRLDQVRMDGGVLAFAAALCLLTVILAGVGPALHAARLSPASALQQAGRGIAGGLRGARLRALLVVSELALAIVLLTGAALLIRTFSRIAAVDPGFRTDNLLTAQIALPRTGYPAARVSAAFTDITAAIRRVPGVASASAVSSLPLGGGGFYLGRVFLREGQPEPPASTDARGAWSVVQPGYFETMGIPIIQGRGFTEADRKESTPVIVISQAMAQEMFPGQNPLGKRIRSWRDENLYREIVGVAGEVRYYGLTENLRNNVYVPHEQNSWSGLVLVIRTAGDPKSVLPAVRGQIRAFDKKLSVFEITTMDAIVETQFARPRFTMLLLGIFAGTALVLAAVGIFGVMAYAVAQRTREIGIRMAMGAVRWDVLRIVARSALRLAGVGALCGIAGALALTRLMKSLLYEVSPTDGRAFLAATGLLMLVAVAAACIPARRAARVDPAITLRHE